jgi:folate-dependent phosphoribosylglycinamide formyltransferase PurN
LKTLILTTKTDHHIFFINSLVKKFNNIDVILEEKKVSFTYKTFHKLFKKRKKYEQSFFFNNKQYKFFDYKSVYDINEKKCINHIKKINPEIIIIFGTGLVKNNFLNQFKRSKIINLHGGNLNYYRGLDSHLWSIYHNDFKNLKTTLHYVDKKFDTGSEIFSKKVSFNKNTKIESLRTLNTLNCIELATKFLRNKEKNLKIIKKKNKSIGRYYSAIPAILIDRCIKNFQNYIHSNDYKK